MNTTTVITWARSIKAIPTACTCRWTSDPHRRGWRLDYIHTRCPIHGTNPTREPPTPERENQPCTT